MAKLTLEEWNALPPEEQDARKDEKPDDAGKKSDDSIDDLKQQLADTNKKIKEMEEHYNTEKGGMIRDLQAERQRRQELEEQLKGKATDGKDPLAGKADDDILTVADLRLLRSKDAEDLRTQRLRDLRERAQERMDLDEERMVMLTEKSSDTYPVKYADALKAFEKLAAKDKRLIDEINREAVKAGGRPALKMYRIALTEDPELSGKTKARTREEIIAELEREGRLPKSPKGGGAGKGELDLANMSDAEIMKAVDENPDAVDRALGKKT